MQTNDNPASVDITREKTLDYRKVPAFIERIRGFRPHISAVYRWSESNSRGIALEFLQTPKGRITSEEAIQRYFEALTRPRAGACRETHGNRPLHNFTDPARKQRVAAKLGVKL